MEEIRIYRSGRIFWIGILLTIVISIVIFILFSNVGKEFQAYCVIFGFASGDLMLVQQIMKLRKEPCMVITDKGVKMMITRHYEFGFEDVESFELKRRGRINTIEIKFCEEKALEMHRKVDSFEAGRLTKSPKAIHALLNERLANCPKR